MLTEQIVSQIPSFCKIKGTAVKNLKKYILSKRGEGYFQEKAEQVNLLKSGLILPSTWYKASCFIHLQMIAAKDFGLSDKEFALDSARYIVEEDLNGIYKFFMKLGGTSLVLGKLPQMNSAYSNFIDLATIENNKGQYIGRYTSPTILCEWNQNGIEGAARSINKLCGQSFDSLSVLEKQNADHKEMSCQTWTFEIKYS